MDVIEQMSAVALVLTLLGVALWWLRRRGVAIMNLPRRAGERRMECLERLPLGPQHTLHLIRLGRAELLVASSPAGCTLVKDLSQETDQ
jgi:flagellar biosynthetic protein FliO